METALEFGRLAKIGKVQILEKTGHMGMFEEKEKSLEAITRFVKKNVVTDWFV